MDESDLRLFSTEILMDEVKRRNPDTEVMDIKIMIDILGEEATNKLIDLQILSKI